MNIGLSADASNSYLQSILTSAFQSIGSNSGSSTAATSVSASDNSQLSPFAQLLSTLQQLQQSNPAKYQQVTQQIGTSLQSAAQQAQSAGNTTAASQLTQLATDFTNASKSDQLPNIQDLAQALGGHHHHGHASSGTSESDSTSSSYSANQNQAANPLAIIFSTLQNTGVLSSSSS